MVTRAELVFSQLDGSSAAAHVSAPCVERYGGDRLHQEFQHVRINSCAMAFAQLTFRESLRDIEVLPARAKSSKLYHLGIRAPVGSQYAGQCQRVARLAHLCRLRPEPDRHRPAVSMPASPFGVDLEETVYALDATTIDLCLSLFPWAVSAAKGSHQAAYAAGSARQYPHFHSH